MTMTSMTRWNLLIIVITITLQFLTPHASIFHIPMERQGALLWCNINIGTPAQTFRVQVDTGSAHLWVLGKSTKKVMGKTGHVFYNGRSKSAKGYRAKWWQRMFKKKKGYQVSYMDGDSFKGEMIIDDIKLDGGATIQASLAIVTSIPKKPTVTTLDGIMGLSVGNIGDSNKSVPFLQQLLQQIAGGGGEEKLDDGGVLSAYLSNKVTEGGELSFGGVNALRFKGDTMHYFPVRKQDGGYHWWDLTLESVGLGSKKGGSSETGGVVFGKGSSATIDTGCNHILVPKGFLDYVMKSTGVYWYKPGNSGKEYPVINCADRQNVDDVVFTIGGIEHRLTGEDYFGMVVPNFCVLLLRDIGNSDDWMLGQPFLRKYYSVFNLDKKEIGLAEANHEHDITLTTSTGLSNSNMTNLMQEDEMVVYNRIINESAMM